MINDNDKILILKKKADLYHSENVPIHITFKKKISTGENLWENGFISSNPTADFFKLTYLEEGKLKHGRDGDFIFFMEVEEIEEYAEVKK